MNRHPHDLLSAYADGELDAGETARVAAHLQNCTECARELALIRSMGGAMRTMVSESRGPDMWESVHRRLTRPAGWLLLVAGATVWCVMALLEWYRARELTWEWMASSAIGIGLALLLVGVLHEQYRDWKATRYKDITR
jgi:predicted anti-sigma-YlaC factor YlaD